MRTFEVTFTAGTGVRRFELREGQELAIGRSRECDLHVASPRLSRRHCVLTFTSRGLTLTDQGSSNGTFVNGRRIQQVLMRPGDIIQVGGVAIRTDFDPKAAAQIDLRCERCNGLVSMARCEDGQVFELGKQFLCPQCMTILRHENLSQAEQYMVAALAEHGFEVEGKTPLSAGIIPVFSATRRDLGTRVMVKTLPLLAGVGEKKIKRFQTEARTAAKVRHENVVEIYDIRKADNALFIVMEHVEGELLLTHIERKGKLPLRAGLKIALRVARALVAAHRQGVVHRDLKPAGILIDANGSPKVCDFGLAKDLWSITSDVTGPEETLGTVRYMPPEQVKNAREADHRADIYSWGATIYHTLTGHPPYHDRGELDLMGQVISGTLPPFDPGGADLPEPLVSLLRKAMAPDPLARFQSADDLEAALGEVIVTHLGVRGYKGDPELLLSLDQGMLDSTWRGPMPGGIAGNFERGDELIEFLQMIEFNNKSGVLVIDGPKTGGQLAFQDGRLRAAVTKGGQRGDEAVNLLLDVREGRFEFRPQLPANFQPAMNKGVSSLLLEVLSRRDEDGAEETGLL
jgi:serine/threonine protein kinase